LPLLLEISRLRLVISEQKEKISRLRLVILEQKEKISEQKEKIPEQKEKIPRQKEKISRLRLVISEQKEKISRLRLMISEQKQKIPPPLLMMFAAPSPVSGQKQKIPLILPDIPRRLPKILVQTDMVSGGPTRGNPSARKLPFPTINPDKRAQTSRVSGPPVVSHFRV
jgi:hypothetical protein